MPRYFTHYWRNTSVDEYIQKYGKNAPVDVVYGDERLLSVSPGDFLYEVTVKEGALYLLSRLEIKTVETRTDSSPYPGETEADAQGYQAEAFQPMSLRRDNRVARAIVEQIQCKTQTGIKNLTFTPSGSGLLDKQTLRATRELTEESAALLNQVIATYEEGHLSEKELKKSGEVIQALRDEEGGFEGASSTKLVNHYERDVKLRAAAIRIHGTRCQACGFSFEETYGEHGADYIEVHHTNVPSLHMVDRYMLIR